MAPIDFSRVRGWMFDAALPLWAECGVDRVHGGFEEELDLKGVSANASFKRTRVLGRQIYVFSHAALQGWRNAADVADHGMRFLTRHAWLGDEGGWARTLARNGDVLDAKPDLYDLAFVLFGLGWHNKFAPAARTRDLARRTLSFINTTMRLGDGFMHEAGVLDARQQNPHMHLLEACLVCYESFHEEEYLRLAGELVELFGRRFFDGATLGEFFDANWRRTSPIVEPGHQFEWAWILATYQRLGGVDMRSAVEALVRVAEQYGVEAQTGLTTNQIDENGSPLDGGSRTWPNTERIKASLALFELAGTDPRVNASSALDALFTFHLNDVRRGLWRERFDANRQSTSRTVPASTLYHLFLAFSELLRLQPRLEEHA